MVIVKPTNLNINGFANAVKIIKLYLAFLIFGFFVCLPTSSTYAENCDNVTSGGEIGTTIVSCGPFDPATIQSISPPSGGSGDIEFLWLKTTDPTLPRSEWETISGWNDPSYDPGEITETTYFLRCARRANCNSYDGESNIIAFIINGIEVQCGPGYSKLNFSGNASHQSNGGVDNSGNASGPIDGSGAKLYDNGDWLKLDLNQVLPAGKKYSLSWKYRNYTSSYTGPAKVDVYESTDGSSYSYNTSLTTTTKDFYVAQTITTAIATRYVKLINATDSPDFEIDAIEFCNSICQSDNPQTCSLENYGEPGSGNNERLLWLNFSTGTELYAVGPNGISFEEHPDGTATITGIAEKTTNTDYKWEVNARLIKKRTWAEWSALGRDFKENNNVEADHTTWSYYELDNSQSTLTGLGENAGLNLILSHSPVSMNYAFQVGYGANVMDSDYGLSGWFKITGDLTGNGDFNGDLENCNDTQTCDNLTDGGEIGNNEAICDDSYDPNKIINLNSPSGGTGDLEYIWVKSYTSDTPPTNPENDPDWNIINGANQAYYDPSFIQQTTYFIRYARRTDCEEYLPSNIVVKAIYNAPEISDVAKGHVSCNNGNDGYIDITIINGKEPFIFDWSNQAGNVEDIENLPAGEYTVNLTDANGCTTSTTVIIEEPTAIELSASNSNIDCFGESNAYIELAVEGGTTPYSYIWNNGLSTNNIDGLAAGDYIVTVTDANGCSKIKEVFIDGPDAALNCTASSTPVSCFDGNNGSASVTVEGGSEPYSYNWNTGADNASIQNIPAGDYYVTVTDAKGCICISQLSVLQPNDGISLSTHKENVSCNGEENGSIDLAVEGGTEPYNYDWSNGADSQDIDGLAANEYEVVVTDANGCTASIVAVIEETSTLETTTEVQDILCNGDQTGSVNLSVSGGTSSYTYNWSNGAETEDIQGLEAGVYTVTVTDSNGCTTITEAEVNSNDPILLSFDKSNANCAQAADGAIDLSINGGSGSYSIQWSNGSTSEDIDNLTAGVYTALVSDQNNCFAEIEINIEEPNALALDITTVNVACNGGNNGSIDLIVEGGTEPYSYAWSSGATTQDLDGLTAGVYSVVITDTNQCSEEINQIVINESSALNATISSTDLTCQNQQNGSATVSVDGGTGDYTYFWNTGATTASIDGLEAGDYSVEINDSNGCSTSLSTTVNQPDAIDLDINITNAICHDGEEGSIDLAVSGGTEPYTYIWNTGAVTEDLDNLNAGDYSVTVTDAQACTAEINGTIEAPSAIIGEAYIVTYIVNAGTSTGAVSVNADGGIAPYTYLWNNGATTQTIDSLPAGIYEVVITDSNGCTAVAEVQLLDAAKIGNRVWEDLNGNGIQEQGEEGVLGVSVKLTGTDNQGNLFTLVTTTNSLGEYCFDGLIPGDYSLRFTLPDGFVFTKAFLGGDPTTDSDANPIDGKTGTISLDYGTINLDIDAGVYRTGKISDFVWEDSNADGIQGDNENGLNQISISLTGTTGAGDAVNLTTISGPNPNDPNEDGYYSFDDLAPGNYTISFNVNSNYYPSPLDQTTEDKDSDVNSMNSTASINIQSGTNDDTVDAGFFRAAKIGNLVWEDFDGDGIQDDGDTGVVGVVANLIDLGSDGEIGGGDDALVNVISTSSDGTYCFADILPGRYAVRFKPNSLPDGYKFTLQDQTDDNEDSDADPITGYTAAITLSSGQNNLSFDAGIIRICDDLSFGGTIGDNESNCGSFDPATIIEIDPASGGTGTISYQWYQSVLANPTTPVNPNEWTLIQGADGATYDPGIIDSTTHYIRTAKREGCTLFVAESNVVTKSIATVDLNLEVDLTNDRCAGSLIEFIAYSSGTDITVTWMFFDGNADTTLLLDEIIGEQVGFTYLKSGEKLIRVIVDDEATGCSETLDFYITILPATHPDCNVLPFAPAFTSFQASIVNQEFVRLDWIINEGDNYENFELERSPNGVNYEVIAAVFGQDQVIVYDYLDRSPYIGRNYYRVKYIRLDGTQFYSDPVSVTIDTNIDANIFPNPTQDYSNINFTNTIRENSILEVVNSNGQVMESKVLPEGTTHTQVDLRNYQPGMYYIYLHTNARRDLIQQILKIDN